MWHKIAPYCNDIIHKWELLYADDTMVMGTRATEFNIILTHIEIESERYNLCLNKDKCFYVGMNGAANIHFKDGTQIKKTDSMTYLGGAITQTRAETPKSVAGCLRHWQRVRSSRYSGEKRMLA